jgi:NAD(P)-dependent dehydrogenase (short-subunit alcohol dehydrogenase family)
MNRTVLVQGASRGLGLEFVRQLLARPDIERVFAGARDPAGSAGLSGLLDRHPDRLQTLSLDVTVEEDIARTAAQVRKSSDRLHWLINVAGVLHGEGMRPERRLEELDPGVLHRAFAINAIGPALMGKHFRDLLCHDEPAVLANLSARIGSIEDNRAGGWYAYRASKAAQNQLTRTMAVEFRRKSPHVAVVALHPGTVDTDLSKPFQRSAKRLFTPEYAVGLLVGLVERLQPADNGSFFAYDGSRIPW